MIPMSPQKRPIAATGIFLTVALAMVLVMANRPAAARDQSGSAPVQPGQEAQQPPIRARVNLVSTPVVVRGSNGSLLLNLVQKDFRVFDNGAEQQIEAFDMGGAPLSITVVVETSSRVASLLPAMGRTGILFTQTVLGENGDAAIIGYNDGVDTLAEFTGDRDSLERVMTHLQVGTTGTTLYDAMARGVLMLRRRAETRRRVLVVLGENIADSGSIARLGQVLRDAQIAGIAVYTIGLSTIAAEMRNEIKPNGPQPTTPPGTFGLPPMPGSVSTPSSEAQRNGSNMDLGTLVLETLKHTTNDVRDHPLEISAAATGGLFQKTFHDNDLQRAVDEIGAELHAQYLLGYEPPTTGSGNFHKIRVEVTGHRGVKVRTRPGYYLAPSA